MMDYFLPTSCRKRSLPTSANTNEQSTNAQNDSSSTANNANSSEQSNLFDLTTLPDIPPLEAAHTFESTSTNGSLNSPLHNDNDELQQCSQHSNEYYSAISSAHYRLQAAQTAHSHCVSQLHVLKKEYERTLRELQSAKLYVRGVEERWGVIDLESDGDDDNEGIQSAGKRRRLNHDQEQEQRLDVGSSDEQSEASSTSLLQQSFEVTSSGESLVNGIYHSTSSDKIYIHSEGPFYIHQQYYDVCIFPKVYGAKIRWCIGLVPCSSVGNNQNDGHDSELEQGDHPQRTRDLKLAFIYYWTMDLPLNSTKNLIIFQQQQQSDDDMPPSFASMSWAACHGVRPLPNFIQVRKQWWKRWQFWRR